MKLEEELRAILADEVISDQAPLKKYSRDASIFEVVPRAVVTPRDSAEIQALVGYVNRHRENNLSLTVRSGGTCMSGGPLTESILLDVSKHFNQVLAVRAEAAIAQPGVYYRDFARAAQAQNLLLPSYPASRDICTLGGMVNNNAGGEKTLAYGKTERYVKRLKVVLSDSHEYLLQPLRRAELQEKLQQPDFEGEIYRQVFELVDKNYDRLQQAKPRVSKNSTGYALWDVWDKNIFDLTKLFVGSQGTLGITTEITFRLITPRPQAVMLVIFLNDLKNLAALVQRVLRYKPESFESYDKQTLKLAFKFAPRLFRRRQHSLLALAKQFWPEIRLMLTGGLPQLILLAEFTGYDAQEVKKIAQAAQASVRSYPIKTRLVTSAGEISKYWLIRHESFNLLRQPSGHQQTVPFIDDFIIRPTQLTEFLPRLYAILEQYNIFYTVAGHVGDANFHIIPLMDLSDPRQQEIIPRLAEQVYDLVFEFGGSMSGEHNDGLIRSHYLPKMYGPEIYRLFEETKKIFDPHNIFNPGKKIGASWDFARQHIVK